MPFAYHIDCNRGIVFTMYSGRITDRDIVGHLHALRSDPHFQPHFRQLTDTRAVDRVEVTSNAIQQIAEENPFGPDAKRALVARDPLIYGLTRMYEGLIHSNNDETRVLTDMLEARAWLGID
jgi:hypothetical protein